MVSSLHPTLSVLGKQGTQGSHPEWVPDLDRGPGTEPETKRGAKGGGNRAPEERRKESTPGGGPAELRGALITAGRRAGQQDWQPV